MKTYYIKDENGSEFEITEKDASEEEKIEEIAKKDEEPVEVKEELVFNADEIAALKKLVPVADKLLKLLEQEVNEEGHDLSDEEEDKLADEDEPKEEVVDTEEEKKELKKDSLKSAYGSTMKLSSRDSLDDLEDKVAQAWAKRSLGK